MSKLKSTGSSKQQSRVKLLGESQARLRVLASGVRRAEEAEFGDMVWLAIQQQRGRLRQVPALVLQPPLDAAVVKDVLNMLRQLHLHAQRVAARHKLPARQRRRGPQARGLLAAVQASAPPAMLAGIAEKSSCTSGPIPPAPVPCAPVRLPHVQRMPSSSQMGWQGRGVARGRTLT